MAIATQPVKKKTNIFEGLPTEEDMKDSPLQAEVGRTLTGMLSGSAYDPYKTASRETFAQAASDLRARSGAENAGAIGQGSAVKAQQGVEQNIFSGLAQNELGIAQEEQAMRERGVSAATDIGKANTGYDVQREQIASQEKTAGEQLGETRRQFDIGEARQTQEFKDTMKLNYDELSQQQQQYLSSLGLDKAKFEQAKVEFAQSQAQELQVAMAGIGIQQAQLSETARQFNISTAQAADQFSKTLRYDYDQLSQQDQQFLATLGLDRDRFNQAKYEFGQTYAQTERLTMAQLNQEDKALAEQAREFNSELAFKNSELAANLSEADKNRIWQAVQNDKTLKNAYSIAQMQNNTEVWKTNEATRLTQLGWTQEAAQAKLDRDLKVTLANKQDALQRWITNGQITQQEADRAQQASQFSTQMEWEREATKLGLAADEAARAWQTNERVASEAFQKSEASLERQLEKEIEAGRMSFQEKQLATQISQFDSEQDFLKSKLAADLSEADKNRLWQSAENAKVQLHDANMQQLQNVFTEKQWSMNALMSSLDALPESQVAQVLSQVAATSGVSYVKTDANGNTMYDEETGEPIRVPGFKTIPSSTGAAWSPSSTLTAGQVAGIKQNAAKYEDMGVLINDQYLESLNLVKWDGSGRLELNDSGKEWAAQNTGKVYKASNGRLYEVAGTIKDAIVFRDMQSGANFNFKNNGRTPFPG